MDPELDDDTSEDEKDAPDLGADLAEALKELDADTDTTEQAAASDTDETDDGAAEDDEQDSDSTDDDGESTEEAAAASDDQKTGSKDDTEASDDDSAAGEDEPGGEEPPLDPPARFSEKAKDTFKTLPREAQSFVLERNQEMEAEYTRKTQEMADQRKQADAWSEAIEPFKPYIASLRTTPQEAFRVLMAAEYTLRNGSPDQKAKALNQLAKDYSIDLAALADQTIESGDLPDPAFNRLNERLDRIERHNSQEQYRQTEQVNTEAQGQVNAFASETDQEGHRLRPHFDDVRSAMSALLSTGEAKDLQEAYDQAVWANPKLRADLLYKQEKTALEKAERDRAEATKKAQGERAAKARAAKKAGQGVRAASQPTAAKDEDADASLRDMVEREYERAAAS